jgi:hypothetical protein
MVSTAATILQRKNRLEMEKEQSSEALAYYAERRAEQQRLTKAQRLAINREYQLDIFGANPPGPRPARHKKQRVGRGGGGGGYNGGGGDADAYMADV